MYRLNIQHGGLSIADIFFDYDLINKYRIYGLIPG